MSHVATYSNTNCDNNESTEAIKKKKITKQQYRQSWKEDSNYTWRFFIDCHKWERYK